MHLTCTVHFSMYFTDVGTQVNTRRMVSLKAIHISFCYRFIPAHSLQMILLSCFHNGYPTLQEVFLQWSDWSRRNEKKNLLFALQMIFINSQASIWFLNILLLPLIQNNISYAQVFEFFHSTTTIDTFSIW